MDFKAGLYCAVILTCLGISLAQNLTTNNDTDIDTRIQWPIGDGSPYLLQTEDVTDDRFDAVVLVTDSLDRLHTSLASLRQAIEDYIKVDAAAQNDTVLVLCDELPSRKLIYSPTGPVNRDYDDVRSFADAAEKGIKRALKTGSKKPLLVRPRGGPFPKATVVAALASLEVLYMPLELREIGRDPKAELLGIWVPSEEVYVWNKGIPMIQALETGRLLTRDIAGSDPERMAPRRVEAFVREAFRNTSVEMSVISDVHTLNTEYPLLGAVNRAANAVKRHRGRVIFLEYTGRGNITRTIFLVGKGITYDTGGADVKTGGNMAGMSRDKSGAAAVAGFMKVISMLNPPNLKVVGAMPMVRNSIGEEGYVSDEVVTSRAGVRVRVRNTDAEGRMIMADVLCQLKEMAVNSVNPHLVGIATLTGHAVRTAGEHYTITLDNGPAFNKNASQRVQAAGETFGDPFEVSRIRREDYNNHKAQSEYEDIVQTGSTRKRGHQGPAAFLIMASGLDKHGQESEQPLPYTHMDIAGSAKLVPDMPRATPVIALSAHFIFDHMDSVDRKQ